jgi:hypothetical protein
MKVVSSSRSRLRHVLRHGGSTFIGLIVVCTLLVVGCDIEETSLPIEENEIWGLYVANYHAGLIETIELKPDHTYVYYFKGRDGKETTFNESLYIGYHDEAKTRPYANLKRFRCPYPMVGLCYSTNQSLAALNSHLYTYGIDLFKDESGKIELVRCPNENQFYVKQKP